ncbi:MAG: response regulator [Bacteroidales bacterium]|nr:response regulator [Bacteroidales bacterium]
MKSLSKIFVACLAWVLVCLPISAVPFVKTQIFNDNDEAIQGRLTQILQDKQGFIWVSTFNGLLKYDSYGFRKYKSLPGKYPELESNRINGIWENSNGDIWCLTGESIYLFKVKEDRFINVQPVLNRNRAVAPRVWNVYCLENGITWMIGLDGECFRLSDDDPLNTCEELPYGQESFLDISRIVLDRHGNEWILSHNGLYRYGHADKTSSLHFVMAEVFDYGVWFVNSLTQTAFYDENTVSFNYRERPESASRFRISLRQNDSILLLCTSKGVYRNHVKEGSFEKISDEDWQNIYVDKQGNYWGVCENYDIVRLSADGKIKQFPRPSDHQYTSYRIHFKEDNTGLLWLVFPDTNDLLYLDTSAGAFVRPATFERSLQEVRNTNFHKDSQGNFWYIHEHEIEYLSLQNSPFEHCPGLLDDEVRAIMQDKSGRYWLSYRKQKVALFSAQGEFLGNLGNDGKLYKNREHSLGASIYAFKQDSRGRIWMGSKNHGLFMLEDLNGSFRLQQFQHDENDPYSLSSQAVYAIEEDDQGRIWIGGFSGGLNLYQDGKFINYFNHLGQNENRPKVIRCMKYLGNNQLMIGAREGLFVMSTDFDKVENIHFYHHYKQAENLSSLSDSEVMSILQTRKGDVWLSTNSGGIARIMASGNYLSEHLSFDNMTKAQGLGSEIAYSLVEDKSGHIWVVSPGNLTRVNPQDGTAVVYDNDHFISEPVFAETLPLVVGEHILFGVADGLIRLNPSELQKDDYCPPLSLTDCFINNEPGFVRLWQEERLLLNRKERNLRLQYAAIDYSEKDHLKYAYYLDGVDRDWVETSNNTLSYTNLPAGKHVLHLRSTNRYGVWMDNELQLPIYVKPRFFESFWGWLCIALLMILLMTAVLYYLQHLYSLRHRLHIEQELSDAKLKFFTDISHELRTPLSLIDGPVGEVLEDRSLSDQSRYYLEVVQKNVRRILNLVNQILDLRKVQSKMMKYLIEPVEVKASLSSLMQNFEEMARQHRIDFNLVCPDDISLWVDRDKFDKIFFNLLSNAFKYTTQGKRIQINVSQDAKTLSIAVEDEGIGIRKDDVDRLFNRYETVMSQNVFKASSGIGLSLVKQFVEGHHARIDVYSQEGKGSRFVVTFLKGKEHFANDKQVEFFAADTNSSEESQAISALQVPISSMESDSNDHLSTLLIVEDNDELRDFMKQILSSGYHVLTAVNGQEGFRMAKEHYPDLIISDVMMPVMNGLEMIRHIKEDEDIYMTPIIVLTANSDMEDRIGAVEMGVDDYVMKPFSANYLKVRVSALIKHRKELKDRLLDKLSSANVPQSMANFIEPDMPEIRPADEIFLQELMAFMEQHMDDADFTIEDFATALSMGRTTFYNKLKATTGLSPVDFVLQIRIKRAVQLMQTRNFSIAEVAYRTGFNDPKYFSRCFKKFHGESPSVFMKKLS